MLLKIFTPQLLLLFHNITKRNELLIHETRINLKHIMLSDRVKKMLLLDFMYVAFYKEQDHRNRKQTGHGGKD